MCYFTEWNGMLFCWKEQRIKQYHNICSSFHGSVPLSDCVLSLSSFLPALILYFGVLQSLPDKGLILTV